MSYLIVGHGIAGALLGHFLEQEGHKCIYVDASEQTSASSVAAGIINPITGRRYVKSWRIEELLPFAEATYRSLEKELGISCYHELPLIRTLFNRGEENDWMARTLDEHYAPYFQPNIEMGNIPTMTVPAFAYMQVRKTAQVDIGTLVASLKKHRQKEGRLIEEEFDYNKLEVTDAKVKYNDIEADRIVFCEGWRSRFNPFFNELPFRGSKGEVLLIRIPNRHLEQMFKHRIFIVPFQDDLYWVGSLTENQFTDDRTTDQGLTFLKERLNELLTVPYEVIEHRAAIRPTVRDRRPFIGKHSQHRSVFLFNGLGTKGASLSPYWAHHMASWLSGTSELDKEVDIRRFDK